MRLHKGPGALPPVLTPRSLRLHVRLVILGQLLLFLGGVFTWGGLPEWADWLWELELLAWDPGRSLWSVFAAHLVFPAAALLASVSLAGSVLLPALLLCRGAALCGTAAHIVSAGTGGFFLSLFLAGLPALVTVPPLLIQWTEGMAFSRSLAQPAPGSLAGRTAGVLAAFFLSCLAAFACIFLERTVIPLLVSLV